MSVDQKRVTVLLEENARLRASLNAFQRNNRIGRQINPHRETLQALDAITLIIEQLKEDLTKQKGKS